MNRIKLLQTFCFLLLLSLRSFGQAQYVQLDQTSYQGCGEITLSMNMDSINYSETINGAFFISGNPSNVGMIIEWGDGITSQYYSTNISPSGFVTWDPLTIQHYYGTTGSFNGFITVFVPNGDSVMTQFIYSNQAPSLNMFLYASVQCGGQTIGQLQNGIPVTISNGNNSFSGIQSNNLVYIDNVLPGTYNITIDQAWLDQNGYNLMVITPSIFDLINSCQNVLTAQAILQCESSIVDSICTNGRVYCDVNNNNVYDVFTDQLLANAPVTIVDDVGNTHTAYTNANGYYFISYTAGTNTQHTAYVPNAWIQSEGMEYSDTISFYSVSCANSSVYYDLPVACGGQYPTPEYCHKVRVFCDANTNGNYNFGETLIPNVPVTFTVQGAPQTSYTVYTDSLGIATACIPGLVAFYTVDTAYLVANGFTFNSYGGVITYSPNYIQSQAVYCPGQVPCVNLSAYVGPWIGYYQNYNNQIKVILSNFSGIAANANVTLTLPAGVTVNASSIGIPGYIISGNTITWNNLNISTINQYYDIISVYCPQGIQSGVIHSYTITIDPVGATVDCDTLNNNGIFCFTVGSSYDPNDKTVHQQERINPAAQDYLTYTIRFQNTGTAPAQDVFILDTLDTDLDFSTIEVLEMSHPMTLINNGNGRMRFDFPQIWLPDSTTNVPESHGYVVYRIRENANNGEGTEIHNTAHIYFDWNEPIVTNTTYNINTTLSISEVKDELFTVFPNPTNGMITIKSNADVQMVEVIDVEGRTVIQNNENTVDLSNLTTGVYLVRVHTSAGVSATRVVKH